MELASVKGAVLQAEFHIFSHAHVGKNRIILEYHADIPLGRVQVIDPRGIKIEIPALNGVESRNHAQKRSLAASGRPQQCKEFSPVDVQRQILDDRVFPVLFHRITDENVHTHLTQPFPSTVARKAQEIHPRSSAGFFLLQVTICFI